MTYLTAEWEASKLKKMPFQSILNEAEYLAVQIGIRSDQIMSAVNKQFINAHIAVPVWKLIEDVNNLNDQFQRVIDEMNRRDIP